MYFSKLTAYLNTLERRYGIHGLDIKITKEHETVYRRMSGHSDYDGVVPVSDRDLYDIYSASKVVTMVGVMQLVEQGRIGLDDPLVPPARPPEGCSASGRALPLPPAVFLQK